MNLNSFIKTIIIAVIAVLSISFSLSANNEIFKAMQDEMTRSMKELKLETLQKPYFIEYSITVNRNNSVAGTLGEITSVDNKTSAFLNVTVRVGTYKFDQKNFFDPGLSFFGSSDEEEDYVRRRIPIELDYKTLRRELWLATDAAYKEAAELYSKKEAALKNQIQKDTTWDFAKQKPVKFSDTSKLPDFDVDYAKNLIKESTKILLDFKNINISTANYYYEPKTIYYLNSEGTQYTKNESVAGFEISAFSQANDGMPLYNFYIALGNYPADLPNKDSLIKATREMAILLDNLLKAPSVDDSYSGPILFSDQAVCETFAQSFIPCLTAQREAVQGDGFRFSGNESSKAFQTKIGGRVLPEFLSVEDLPNLTNFNKIKLVGSYKIDDEGVLPEDVVLIKDGYLKTLLSDRKPIKRIPESNGHNRSSTPMVSNVKIEADKKYQSNEKDLKNQLIKLCKQRDLPFGIIVKKVANTHIVSTTIYRMTKGGIEYPRSDGGKLQPIEVYKIYTDGREELVRGGQLAGMSTAAFKDIIKTGNSFYVHNMMLIPPFSMSSGFLISYMPVSIIAPNNLLFEDAELQVIDKNFKKPPYLSNPVGLKN